MAFRKPTADELRLLRVLGEASGRMPRDWLGNLLVEDMSDGGMGSLKLHSTGDEHNNRRFGERLAACQFTDADSVEVIASLNADSEGVPFELDMWKVDFSPLVRIATKLRILDEPG